MKVMWQTRKLGSGAWEGTIDVPCGTAADVRVASKAKGPTQAHALARAATVAETALESPILQAALPPQARLALQGIKELAQSKLTGEVTDLARSVSKSVSKGLKKLKFW